MPTIANEKFSFEVKFVQIKLIHDILIFITGALWFSSEVQAFPITKLELKPKKDFTNLVYSEKKFY